MKKYYHDIHVETFWPASWINPSPPEEKKSLNHLKLVSLSSSSKEYQNISKSFTTTVAYRVKNPTVISIERNENYDLWKCFIAAKAKIKLESKENEKFLYHGSSEDILKVILKNGFDHRVGDMQSAKYGAGTYFATQAGKSDHFALENTNKEKKMIVARVELGDVYHAQSTMIGVRKPPLKQNSTQSHHSIMSPDKQEYVIFNNDQVYPEYLITYKA